MERSGKALRDCRRRQDQHRRDREGATARPLTHGGAAHAARQDQRMKPHLRYGALAAALLVLSRCAGYLFSTFNHPDFALVGLAPLLPFDFTVGGGPHGRHRPEWLIYTV